MRILHVIPSVSERSGGPGQAIFPMCRALAQHGIEVLLISTDHGLREEGVSVALSHSGKPMEFTHKGVPAIFFPTQWGDSFKYSGSLARWLEHNVSAFDVVHIHAVFNHACIAAARACRRHHVPYIIRPLGTLASWSLRQKSLRKALFWHTLGRPMLTNAGALHCTAQEERIAAQQELGLSNGRVVPLGIEAGLFESAERNDRFPFEHPDLKHNPYVLVLSRLHPKKGLDIFLQAFLPLSRQNGFANWRLVLAGEGPGDYVAKLKTMVREAGAEDVVLFPGWLDGEMKASALNHAALLALPSHHENFGLCVMESLACGVPVLVSPHVNLANEIETARAGWIAPVDSEALQRALAEIFMSPDERQKRGEAGRQLAAKFDWAVISQSLIEIYSEVGATRVQDAKLHAGSNHAADPNVQRSA